MSTFFAALLILSAIASFVAAAAAGSVFADLPWGEKRGRRGRRLLALVIGAVVSVALAGAAGLAIAVES